MEFVSANDKQEATKCGHFSIRGYVAEIRKKDSTICWPFPTVDSYKDSKEQADVLPPLNVTEFRWWGCQNCMKKSESIGGATKTGEILKYSNNRFKTRIFCSHGDEPKLIDSIQQASTEKSFEGRKANAETTINVNGDEYGFPSCSNKKDKQAAVVYPIGEDIFTSKGNDGDANDVGKIKISFNTDKHRCNLSARETSNATKSICNDDNTSETETVKAKGNGSIECCQPIYGSCNLSDLLFDIRKFKCTSDSFRNDENIVRNNVFGHCASQNGDSDGSLHRKKIKKVRLLADIIRSEALGASGRDANIDHIKKETAQFFGGPENQVAVEGTDRVVILGKKKKREMPQDKDLGPLQKRCPKGTPEKVRIFNGVAETRDVNSAKSESDAFVGKSLHSCLGNLLTEHGNDERKCLSKKKGTMAQVEDGNSRLMPWQKGMSTEVQMTRRDVQSKGKKAILGKNKFVNSQVEDEESLLMFQKDGKDHVIRRNVDIKNKDDIAIPFRSGQGEFSGGGMCHGPSHADTKWKAIMIKKRNSMPIVEGGGNMPHVEYGGSSQFSWPEVFSGSCENSPLRQDPKVLKKQCDETSEQTAVDDIPMDIVELMAKNQHERLLFNAKATTENRNCLSRTYEVKDVDPMNFTEVLGSEMSRLMHDKDSRTQKTHSSNEGSHMCNRIHFSISQPEQSHSSMGFTAFSQSQEKLSIGAQFPVIGSSINRGDQNFNLNENAVQNRCSLTRFHSPEAYHTSHTVSHREDHRVGSSMIPNGIQLGKQKRKFDSETNKRTLPKSSPFAWRERENEIHPKMTRPLDLYTNETIPAMYLLRLMDPGVCSTTPVNVDKNQKFTRHPPIHHREELLTLELGQTKNSKALMPPPSSVCFDKNQRSKKPGEHFPSAPKVNIVGSSLQKDYDKGNFSAKLMSNSLKSQVKGKTKSKMVPTDPTLPRDDGFGKNHKFYDFRRNLSASDSMPFLNNSATCVEPCGTEICVINRNPADFSAPEARNVYMIGPRDLKHRRMLSSRDRPNLIDPNEHKRQRMMKLMSIEAHLLH